MMDDYRVEHWYRDPSDDVADRVAEQEWENELRDRTTRVFGDEECPEIVAGVYWPHYPLDPASLEKHHYGLCQEQIQEFRAAFPKSEINNPPWHLVEYKSRHVFSCKDVTSLTAAKLFGSLRSRMTIGHRRNIKSRLSHPFPAGTGILDYAELAAYRFRILQLAVLRDVAVPSRGNTRVQRLVDRWNAAAESLKSLRDESLLKLRQMADSCNGFSLYDDVHHRAHQMYVDFEMQLSSAREIDEWVRTGGGPRADDYGNEVVGMSHDRMNYCLNWFRENSAAIREFADSQPDSESDDCAEQQGKGCSSEPLTCRKVVTVKQIAEALVVSKSRIRNHSKSWGTPFKMSRRRGGGAEWCIEGIWDILVEQLGKDEHGMSALIKLKDSL